MNIRDALAEITRLQETLAITSPIPKRVLKAWPYIPPQSAAFQAIPCCVNEWSIPRVAFGVGLRERFYTVRMQLVVLDADIDKAHDIASAFDQPVWDTFTAQANADLAGTVTDIVTVRGGTPTLGGLDRGGQHYTALEYFLDLVMKDSFPP